MATMERPHPICSDGNKWQILHMLLTRLCTANINEGEISVSDNHDVRKIEIDDDSYSVFVTNTAARLHEIALRIELGEYKVIRYIEGSQRATDEGEVEVPGFLNLAYLSAINVYEDLGEYSDKINNDIADNHIANTDFDTELNNILEGGE